MFNCNSLELGNLISNKRSLLKDFFLLVTTVSITVSNRFPVNLQFFPWMEIFVHALQYNKISAIND